MKMQAIAAIGRLYPFLSGNFRLVNYSKFSRLFSGFSGEEWCNSPGGPMLVPLDDAVGRCIFFSGDYDRKITRLCRKLLRHGDTALDIGANLGVVTMAMAAFVGPRGTVHSFEPNPSMQKLLLQSVKRSHQNVTLHPVALGASDGEMPLYFPAENAGAGSLIRAINSTDQSVICKVRRLDDVLAGANVGQIRLIKIDVEGFENEVLKGAARTLAEARPFIILETNEPNGSAFADYPVIKTLVEYDYIFFAIPKAFFSVTLVEIATSQTSAPSHDIVACPRELSADLL